MKQPERPAESQGGLFGDIEVPAKTPANKPPKKPVPRPNIEAAGYVHVALDRPLRTEFTYAVPAELLEACRPGVRVAVPFGARREVGVVVGTASESELDPAKTRAVAQVLDAEPVVDSNLLELTRWIATEYACSWGQALGAILPAPLKRERGVRKTLRIAATEAAAEALAGLEEKQPKQHRLLRTLLEIDGEVELRDLVRKLDLSDAPARTLQKHGLVTIRAVAYEGLDEAVPDGKRRAPDQLSDPQAFALAAIQGAMGAEGGGFLLHGVTGSGKTEVYLRAISAALENGRGAIVLVPEIALTPQTVGWFRSRFGDVAVLHSRMTDSQRLAGWRRVQSGEVRVVVGARSAIFAPVRKLGVIVLDEEHEPSFKQGNVPRYHAREVALRRAAAEGAVCVLGSATPSLESYEAARAGTLKILRLPERVGGGRTPQIKVVDMRLEPADRLGAVFSKPLREQLVRTLERKEQSILFLNRRGHSPVLWCHACRAVVRCEDCDSPITFHRRIQRMVCHLCSKEQRVPKACPGCTAPGLRMLGVGAERVEAAVRELLPTARVRRMDSDTMHRREDYERTLAAFGAGEVDCLVGTQMIAKGLDFPRVTLVGIISADTGLHLPDFRASERTFQLLSQVAGRAGRAELEGRIVIQTESPEHPAIRFAAVNDFAGFAEAESGLRRELGYPPHGRLVRIIFESEDEDLVASTCDSFATALRGRLTGAGAVLLGPAPAPLALLRNRHRHHILIKAAAEGPALDLARTAALELAEPLTKLRVLIDVDPSAML